jgi:bifunctional non-homologous end joining protein LigD
MRARPVGEAFDAADYLFETRWNGIRALATIAGGHVRLRNRRLGDLTARFPELGFLAVSAADQPLLVDGEIVIVDEHGHPDFDAAQWRLRLVDRQLVDAEALRKPACFLASDLLFRGQRWLLGEPLQRRKRQLVDALHQADCLYLAECFEGEGRALFQAAVESELEGVLAKPRDGLYAPGGFGWLSVERDSRNLVLGGYSLQIVAGARAMELLLGAYDDEGALRFVAAVQPPRDERQRNELFTVLNALQVEASPFAGPPPAIACWVRPELVVSAAFKAAGPPRFERVRLDVSPDECLQPASPPAGKLPPPRETRPQLTMLTTLPLPLDGDPAGPAERPRLRLVDER